jgi:hypothetical protein
MKFMRPGENDGSEDGFDFGVEGDVGGGEAVDGEFGAGGFGEMEEAADMVVLVIAGEEAFGFLEGEAEGGERDGLAEVGGVGAVEADEFAQGHERSVASGFGAQGILRVKSTAGRKRKEEFNAEDTENTEGTESWEEARFRSLLRERTFGRSKKDWVR